MNRMIHRLAMLGLAGSIAATALILGGKVSAGPATPPPMPPAPVWGQAVGGLRISATANKDRYACGEPVILSVIVQNVDTRNRDITHDDPQERDFWITVVDQDGKQMPLTRFGIHINPSSPVMRQLTANRIPPGGELTWTLVPSRVADMTLGGRFTITVSHDIAPPGGPGPSRVVSNPVVASVDDWNLPGTSPQAVEPHQ
jgi:hypothetical protein